METKPETRTFWSLDMWWNRDTFILECVLDGSRSRSVTNRVHNHMSRLQKVRVSGLVSVLATFLERVLDGYRSWSEMNRVQNGSQSSAKMGGGFTPWHARKEGTWFLPIVFAVWSSIKKLSIAFVQNFPNFSKIVFIWGSRCYKRSKIRFEVP